VTNKSVRIHPAALEEAEVATAWYGQRSAKAAEMFLEELDREIERIGANPEQFPLHEFGTRRPHFADFHTSSFFEKQSLA